MAASDKWYFTKEQLESTPSRKCGYDTLKELSYRQQAANFIQDMGQRLKVSQLCINTAIVYMHRFYVFHSFTNFPWHQMASAALFLAAKVEEQPRKLEYVIRVANVCRNPKDPSVDITSDKYLVQSQDLVFNENVLLQTLGFDVAIDHPHTHVVRCCQLVRASKDLAQTSYFMASNSLHLTTMCLQYKPTVVACFCIHLACKWSNWEIPLSNEKKEWFSYVDSSVTAELLQQLTEEFLVIFESCPSRLKEKIMAIGLNIPHSTTAFINSPFDQDPKKIIREDSKDNHIHRSQHEGKSSNEDPHKHRSYRPHDPNSQQQREREYREKKERERLAQMPSTNQKPTPHGHHRPPIDQKHKFHSRPPTTSNYPPQMPVRVEPRDILREATRDSPFGIAANRDSLGKETVRDPQVRSDKDKRDHLLKSNVTDTNNLKKYADGRPSYSADKHRVDPSRQSRPVDPNKVPSKHDAVRRHDESKPLLKTDTDNMKKHANANVYFNKPTNTTSQKLKSPYRADASKSVPKQPNSQHKLHQRNGSSGTVSNSGSYGNPLIEPDKIKTEVIIKEEIPSPTIIKRPSLFSPEKTPPQSHDVKSPSRSLADISSILPSPSSGMVPLESPGGTGRTRNYSSSSEPELRPVMKKIDQVEGFENLKRESSIGINKLHQTSDIINTFNQDVKIEMKEEVISPLKIEHKQNSVAPSVNGIETNPTLISNLLKETPPVSHLSTVSQITEIPQVALEVVKVEPVEREREHHHHKSKKKNKDKHKHKDKDKNREDREKKKKHKDKDREKHKHREKNEVAKEITPSEPTKSLLVIKIQKDKIQSLPEMPGQGLKIKIPKEKIKTDGMGELSQPITQPPTGGLKIKIPKEVINNCNDSVSKKRERDRSFNNDGPPAKVPKTYKESKHNGRHSYNKVHLGEGDLSQSRLAESKYTNKNSSS